MRPGVIQRLVLLVSQDEMASNNYNNLINNPQDPTYADSLREGGSFDELGMHEALHLVTHGDGRGRVEGQTSTGEIRMMNATEFLDMLISAGFDPYRHRGPIRLLSCFSSSVTAENTTFANDFIMALSDRNFRNTVIGFNGLVRVRPGAQIDVAPPSREAEFNELSAAVRNNFNTTMRSLRAPNFDPQSEENQRWKANLDRLREEGARLRDQVNALFAPADIRTNMTADMPRPNTRPLPNPWAMPPVFDPAQLREALEKIKEMYRQRASGGSCKGEACRFFPWDDDQGPPSSSPSAFALTSVY